MQVLRNYLKNNQTKSKWQGCETWYGICLRFGEQAVVEFMKYLWTIPQNHNFENIRFKVLSLLILKIQTKGKGIPVDSMQIIYFTTKYEIWLKIVKRQNNVECGIAHFASKWKCYLS